MPPLTRVASSQLHYVDSTGMTRGVYTGAIETTAYGGDRLGVTVTLAPAGGLPGTEQAKRAAVLSWVASLRGRQGRTWMQDHSHRRRGAFPTGELLANNIFTGGTTGWTGSGVVSVADCVARMYPPSFDGSTQNQLLAPTAGAVVTPFAPYVFRMFVGAGRGNGQYRLLVGASGSGAEYGFTPILNAYGMATLMAVPYASPVFAWLQQETVNGGLVGDYLSVSYASLSRCMLADGGPNLLLHSDTPGGTSWSVVSATAAANGSPGPDGLTDAFYLAETTAAGGHQATQTATVAAAAQDYTFSVFVKSVNRSWCVLQMVETAGGTGVTYFFNVASGTVGTTQVTGGNWANLRASAEGCGNGWFRFSITARKTNGATGVTVALSTATADGTSTFVGVASPVAFLTWRATLSASSFPTRATQTLAAAAPAANDAAGYVYVKGLPASAQGLLLAGDQVQVGRQLAFVTASLDSNEAGLGYLQISPPLRYAPADNDAVIVHNPMARFVFVGQYPQWANVPGVSTTADLDFEEACEP